MGCLLCTNYVEADDYISPSQPDGGFLRQITKKYKIDG